MMRLIKKKQKKINGIKLNIDQCVVYEQYIVIRGWAFSSQKEVKISLLDSNRSIIPNTHLINEERPDVLAQYNKGDITSSPGFVILYENNHAENILPELMFETSDEKVCVPLHNKGGIEHILTNNIDFINKHIKINKKASETSRYNKNLKNEINCFIEYSCLYNNRYLFLRGWAITENSTCDIFLVHGEERIHALRKNSFHRGDLSPYQNKFGYTAVFDILDRDANALISEICYQSRKTELPINIQKIEFQDAFKLLIDDDNHKYDRSEAHMFLMTNLEHSYINDLYNHESSRARNGFNLAIDYAFTFKKGCFITGWIDNELNNISGLYITNGIVISENLIKKIYRIPRPDVNVALQHLSKNYKAGFYCYTEIAHDITPIKLIALDKNGDIITHKLPTNKPLVNAIDATKALMGFVDIYSPSIDELFSNHIKPALNNIWSEDLTLPSEHDVIQKQYGNKVKDPVCSIIIPLYGRYDFVLHQISQFVSDPDFSKIEILYVNDDPRIQTALDKYCIDISELFPISFKVISYGRNLGFSGANNIGVRYASSEVLLLLNSDVIPTSPGWIGRIQTIFDSCENLGVLGVKLIYEDHTIQHHGMTFNKIPELPSIWLNQHPYKGYPEWMVDTVGLSPAITITGACLFISKDTYNFVGGFDNRYILGDFEDSDLCLKLYEAGYQNYFLGSEKLYHLERQSQSLVDSGDWKFKLTIFNGWQHAQRWDQLISNITSN